MPIFFSQINQYKSFVNAKVIYWVLYLLSYKNYPAPILILFIFGAYSNEYFALQTSLRLQFRKSLHCIQGCFCILCAVLMYFILSQYDNKLNFKCIKLNICEDRCTDFRLHDSKSAISQITYYRHMKIVSHPVSPFTHLPGLSRGCEPNVELANAGRSNAILVDPSPWTTWFHPAMVVLWFCCISGD